MISESTMRKAQEHSGVRLTPNKADVVPTPNTAAHQLHDEFILTP